MLISGHVPYAPHPMSNIGYAGELCVQNPVWDGVSGIDDIGIAIDPFSNIATAAASIYGTYAGSKAKSAEAKIQKQQLKLAQQQAKSAAEFEKAAIQAELSDRPRKDTTKVLYAIGGLAALVSLVFVVATVRKKKAVN